MSDEKKKTSVNDVLNAPLSYLDSNRKANHSEHWDYVTQPCFKLLTSGLGVEKEKTHGNGQPEEKKNSHFRYALKVNGASLGSSLICVFIGLIIGFLFMLISPENFGEGFASFWSTGFGNLDKVLYTTGPLLLCALSVGFCYKCGLFNIGASGQYTMGAMVAIICALHFGLPWYASCFFAILAGGLVGSIPGLLKAHFNINEVITAIMLNWIVLFLCDTMMMNISGVPQANTPKTRPIANSSNPNAMIPYFSTNQYLNSTIFFGVAIAIVIFVVLYFTRVGYKMRAVGFNRDAAQYAGISSKKNIIMAFVVSGAMAGLGGACTYLLNTVQLAQSRDAVAAAGFDAIPIALLANSNPIGIIFSSFFISFLKVAGNGLQGIGSYNDEFVNVMISVILYVSGFAVLFMNIFLKDRKTMKPGSGSLHRTKESVPMKGGKAL
jgi:general nucleoside transport system permease protein